MTTADEVHRDEASEFTEQEFQFIFGGCCGLRNAEIAERYGITEQSVMTSTASVYDKVGVSTRLELAYHFVRAALNAELQRRLRGSPITKS